MSIPSEGATKTGSAWSNGKRQWTGGFGLDIRSRPGNGSSMTPARTALRFWITLVLLSAALARGIAQSTGGSPGTIFPEFELKDFDSVGGQGSVTLRIRDYHNGDVVWGLNLGLECSAGVELVPGSFTFNPPPDPWLPSEGQLISENVPSDPKGGTISWLVVPTGPGAGETNGTLVSFMMKRTGPEAAVLTLRASVGSHCVPGGGALLGLCIPSPGPIFAPVLVDLVLPEIPELAMDVSAGIAGEVVLKWPARTPACELQESVDLEHWNAANLELVSEGGTNVATVSETDGGRFYRLACP